MPFSALDSTHPEDLWNWMDAQRKAGNELLAISHNANVSDGWMYPIDVDSYGRPIDAAWAASRDRNERLVEIKQIKGQSETHPLLSPNDEFASYELYQAISRSSGRRRPHRPHHGSFAPPGAEGRHRHAGHARLQPVQVRHWRPLRLAQHRQPLPPGQFLSAVTADADGTVERRFAGVLVGGTMDVRLENPGRTDRRVGRGEHPRLASGTRCIARRPSASAARTSRCASSAAGATTRTSSNAKDWVKQSYAQRRADGRRPASHAGTGRARRRRFVVWAVKDPTSANLDRIQIVKGWTQNGQSFEKIFDVAWSGDRKPDKWSGRVPAIQSTVDLEKATYTNNVGSTELKTVWTDPEFDASLHAFYYARVLEIPTPRWTLIQAVKAGIPPPDVVPLTGQERAWSSPIWYTPSAEARKNAPAGMTVADLKKKGATQLGDAQLKALIVGKAFWVRNNVTGEQFSVTYTTEGQSIVWHVGKNADTPSSVGNLVRDGYQGTTTPYKIEGGKLVTTISQDPFCGHDLQAGRHLLRRAQQRIRLCQLRDHSDAAVCSQSAYGNDQPVLD